MGRPKGSHPLGGKHSGGSGEPDPPSESELPRPAIPGSHFVAYGPGDQNNAPGGNQNISTGNGNHFPGAVFNGPVSFEANSCKSIAFDSQHLVPNSPSHSITVQSSYSLRDCLRSLYFQEMDWRFYQIEPAAQGTCEWLIRHETYTSWASCHQDLLWIKGKPGSGKSTLLQYALKAARTNEDGALILSFFFHGRGTDLQKTPLGLFQSLLHQLLSKVPGALPTPEVTFKQRCENINMKGAGRHWNPQEVQHFFESSLEKALETHPVWLFVDALDECGKDHATKLAEGFNSLLQRLSSTGLKQFHICFTCRHYPIIALDGKFQIRVEEENEKDISTYVQGKLSSFKLRTSPMIPELITNRANRVFLWAWIVVGQVLDHEREGRGLKEIEAIIWSVPQKLDDLYSHLLQGMVSESLKLVQWICFAMIPLSLAELRWAMIVDAYCPHQSLHEFQSARDFPADDDGLKRRVQTLGCGLVEVMPDNKFVQFIHQSVRDFFIEKGLLALHRNTSICKSIAWADSALVETAQLDLVGIGHHRLGMICIRYFAMEEIGQSLDYDDHEKQNMEQDFPFLHYAATAWVTHMQQSDARGVPQEDLLDCFAWPSNTLVDRWAQIYCILDIFDDIYPGEVTSLVHIVSGYGGVGALEAIFNRMDMLGIDINAKDCCSRTPLSHAAERGNEATVRLLLDRGADIEAPDKDGRTPLFLSAENRQEAIVRLLLGRGADTEAAEECGQTPLVFVARDGYENIVRLLLDQGANIDAADNNGRTSLSWAGQEGHEAIVRLLLDQGANVDAADQDGWTPIAHAAERGKEAIVRLLLTRGAYINAADKNGQRSLSRATHNGHDAIVRILLEWGTDIEAAEECGDIPLVSAARDGYEDIVRLLLDQGANIDAADNNGRTSLSWATQKGHEAIVRLLLDCGANIDAADKKGRTPLSYADDECLFKRRRFQPQAVREAHFAIWRLLIDRSADTDAVDKNGRTRLSYADDECSVKRRRFTPRYKTP